MNVTPEEKKVIAALKRVAKIWPDSLWLFSGSGTLYVMKKRNGKRVMLPTEGVDSQYEVTTIDIENDGGDW